MQQHHAGRQKTRTTSEIRQFCVSHLLAGLYGLYRMPVLSGSTLLEPVICTSHIFHSLLIILFTILLCVNQFTIVARCFFKAVILFYRLLECRCVCDRALSHIMTLYVLRYIHSILKYKCGQFAQWNSIFSKNSHT